MTDVASDLQDKGLAAQLVIDRDTAARLGIAMADIDNTLYDAFGQRQVSTIFTQLNQYHVVMEVGQNYQTDPATLSKLYVSSASGTEVPLSMLAHWEQSHAQLSIGHLGQFPSTIVSFNLAQGKSLGDAVKAVQGVEQRIQMPASINASFQGTAAAFQTSLANEPLLILAALITVYIVLGVLYESYIHPITIISTLPSAGVGALLALLITRVGLQCDCVDRHHSADRHCAEERHHDDRLCPAGRARRGQDRRGRDLPGLPAALQAHHHDHDGGAAGRIAAGSGRRRGRRAAHAAGRDHRRRPDLLADAHSVHDAGRLPLLRQAGPADEPREQDRQTAATRSR